MRDGDEGYDLADLTAEEIDQIRRCGRQQTLARTSLVLIVIAIAECLRFFFVQKNALNGTEQIMTVVVILVCAAVCVVHYILYKRMISRMYSGITTSSWVSISYKLALPDDDLHDEFSISVQEAVKRAQVRTKSLGPAIIMLALTIGAVYLPFIPSSPAYIASKEAYLTVTQETMTALEDALSEMSFYTSSNFDGTYARDGYYYSASFGTSFDDSVGNVYIEVGSDGQVDYINYAYYINDTLSSPAEELDAAEELFQACRDALEQSGAHIIPGMLDFYTWSDTFRESYLEDHTEDIFSYGYEDGELEAYGNSIFVYESFYADKGSMDLSTLWSGTSEGQGLVEFYNTMLRIRTWAALFWFVVSIVFFFSGLIFWKGKRIRKDTMRWRYVLDRDVTVYRAMRGKGIVIASIGGILYLPLSLTVYFSNILAFAIALVPLIIGLRMVGRAYRLYNKQRDEMPEDQIS